MYHMTRLPAWFYPTLLGGLIVTNISIYQELIAPAVLRVTVLEVEKGSATLLRTPTGTTILIDTGPDAGILRALGTTLPPWQRSIDAVVLTSTKAAFAGGLPDVEKRYSVARSFSSGSRFSADGVSIEVLSAGEFEISHEEVSMRISSSTPKGDYFSDGEVLQKKNTGTP